MKNGKERYEALRRRYPLFRYVGYRWQEEESGFRLEFDFRMGDVHFRPTALIERRPFLDFGLPRQQLDRLVFDIGMVELVSYWKCACPPMVRVECGPLTPSQMAFWKKLYWHGLGEFFYINGIQASPEAFMTIEAPAFDKPSDSTQSTPRQPASPHAYLVPVGGGKDSVVTLELLRRAGKEVRPLIMNPRGATIACAQVAGFAPDKVLVIRRTIDPTLLRLNAETDTDPFGATSPRYLNGHTPFSAMLAFYTRLAAAMSGIPNVALSNENSANEATVLVYGRSGAHEVTWAVNHQYSKSLEFEDDFRKYCLNGFMADGLSAGAPDTPAVTPSRHQPFNYFSFLRPLSELQIAMLFSRMTRYHDVFRSCNVGSKQDIWCGHCAKCLFAYIILAPFIEPSRMEAIFGHNLLDDTTLRHEFDQLVGRCETKPFECVGTVGEVRQALAMTLSRWYVEGPRPALLAMAALPDMSENGYEPLDSLLPIGNLSSEERNIIAQCIANKS